MEIDVFKTKDPVFYNLNQGIFNDSFYFGKVHYIENQPTDAIILSNRQYFLDYSAIKIYKEELIDGKIKKQKVPYGENQIKANGLNYRNSIIENSYFWSNNAIDAFVNNKSEQIDKVDLFNDIKTQLEQYMDIDDNRVFDVVASYILGTYCFSLFNSYGYLFLNCEKNSGKTKFTNLIGFMAFNATNATNPSEASLFRLCESNKPTFLIDDYEKMEDEKQKYINQILKTGYKRGGQTLRIDTNENNRVRMFDLYSPKIINNVGDLEEITLSRCILIRLMRTKTDKGKIDPIETNPIWKNIRDKCYLFIMQNWRQIKEIYDNYQTDAFNNRNLEISKGILSIAKHISPEAHNNVESFLEFSFNDRDYVDFSSNKHYLLFKIILDKVDEPKEYAVEEIVSWLKEDYDNFGEQKKYCYWVGRTLSKIPMFKERRDRTSKRRRYFLSRELIVDYMDRQNYPTPESELSEMTYKVFDDEVKVMKEEIMDDCACCKVRKLVKFRSIIVQGRNYCVNCVETDIRKQKSNKVLVSVF